MPNDPPAPTIELADFFSWHTPFASPAGMAAAFPHAQEETFFVSQSRYPSELPGHACYGSIAEDLKTIEMEGSS
jgi:hypothetical protein